MINDNIHNNSQFGSVASDVGVGGGSGGNGSCGEILGKRGDTGLATKDQQRHHPQQLPQQDSGKVNIDDHLNSMSQFIYLEAAEAAGRQEEDEERGNSNKDQEIGGIKQEARNNGGNHLGAQNGNGGPSSVVASSLDIMSVQDNEDLNNEFNEFVDIPNLVSDNESDGAVTVSTRSVGYWNQQRSLQPTPVSTTNHNESVTSPHPVQQQSQQPHQQQRSIHQQVQQLKQAQHRAKVNGGVSNPQIKQNIINSLQPYVKANNNSISAEQFKHQRTQLMTIIVKYVATKIYNTFPPEAPKRRDSSSQSPSPSSPKTPNFPNTNNELPLDKFLLLLTSRLRVTLPIFLKAIIYLFRYMDIIYLLRYLNQTNNFVNYNDMGFELKKLIVGCFKLTIIKENRVSQKKLQVNWQQVTGLSNQEINSIVKQLVNRMNGKLNIKDVEVVRMKNEMYRFVNLCL
ncbi:hypothetical protein CANMA_004760 [Candida margitis]|uniref:uncharacterized protein n=1 Tax=Candida margitis TaxID=1775924 RepID=UPI002225BFAE|nr:uncharacterized protein CANMA_004760 [Candida margitis]KAI5953921.1 hypothetical protein CANMA_004760 [Candida margitis]